MIPWLPEPSVEDQTYAKHGEHTLDWLYRSTNPRAVECRRFLNENVAALPESFQGNLKRELRNRWASAFFELVVARTLQEMGATLAVEELLSDGKRPDFTAAFPDGIVIVEANAPIINRAMKEEMRKKEELLAIVDSYKPVGWHIVAYRLPNIGHAESKKEFKKVIKEILSVSPPLSNDQSIEVKREIDSGVIDLCLYADNSGDGGPSSGPIYTVCGDAQEKIRYAVKNKRRQVRNAQYPAVLAIQGEEMFTDPEDFDRALFGDTMEKFDEYHRLVETRFKESGALLSNSGRDQEPTFAAVLVFPTVGFARCSAPILYWHPRATTTLPASFHVVEQRRYNREACEIQSTAASNSNLMDGLHCVNPAI